MLQIKNLTKKYSQVVAVRDLSLEIKTGEIFGFIGPNGAGKSTTIRAVMDFINKDNGEVYINGELFDRKNYKLKEFIGYLPSEINLYDDYTVLEMFKYNQKFYSFNCMDKAYDLSRRLELDVNKKLEELSFGNLKKVGIVLTLMHSPKLIIMDEATSGLDPLMQEEFYSILKDEKAKGTTIFFSTHILSEIKKICDRVGIIKNGELLRVDTIDNIIPNDIHIITLSNENNSLKEKYLESIIFENEKEFRFFYDKKINLLLNELVEINVEKILIEEPSIEDVFMHYYK